MKKSIVLAIPMVLLLSGCFTILGKKSVVLVDAPKNLAVTYNGQGLEIEQVTAFRAERGNTTTLYKYPGVRLKMKKKTELELKLGNKSANVKMRTKPAIGGLIVEFIFTTGIGTIVDLATNSFWYAKNRFIDVPAYLNNKPPRTEKELKEAVKSQY